MANLRGGKPYPARRYLRGSKMVPYGVASSYKPQTLQNQINQLKYRTGMNRRELQSVTFSPTDYTSTGSVFEQFDKSISATFVGLSRFRDLVNGDRWRNLKLKLNLRLQFTNMDVFRIVVYHSRDADTTWSAGGFLSEPDPSAFTVLWDECINADYTDQDKNVNRYIPLKGLHSIYNASGSFWEKGNIRIAYLVLPQASGLTCVSEVIQYHFQNI